MQSIYINCLSAILYYLDLNNNKHELTNIDSNITVSNIGTYNCSNTCFNIVEIYNDLSECKLYELEYNISEICCHVKYNGHIKPSILLNKNTNVLEVLEDSSNNNLYKKCTKIELKLEKVEYIASINLTYDYMCKKDYHTPYYNSYTYSLHIKPDIDWVFALAALIVVLAALILCIYNKYTPNPVYLIKV